MTDTHVPGSTGSHLPYVCDTCGREFPTATSLGGHRSSGHRPKEPCPQCGKVVTSGVGLVKHLAIHDNGHRPKKRGRPFGSKNVPKAAAIEVAPLPIRIVPAELTVDDIVVGTVGMLYLDGTVPITKLPSLFAWRDATQLMLEEIR